MAVQLNNIHNFADLLSLSGIKIPMLQRDYVQGRIHNTAPYERKSDSYSLSMLVKYKEEKEKRDGFVQKLVDALIDPNKTPLELTFIYGISEDSSSSNSSLHHPDSFVPLDGQQRLTTLFLLAWSLINKIPHIDLFFMQKPANYKDMIKGLGSFIYMTRPSSDLFCTRLFSCELLSVNTATVSAQIECQPWFEEDWKLDPSVTAMLQMLDAINSIIDNSLKGLSLIQHSLRMQNMLTNLVEGRGITFELLDMNQYKLTDSLYIKMNARGKQLSRFENWKSEFIGMLKNRPSSVMFTDISHTVLTNVFNGNYPNLYEYFTYSIEHQWTDMLWQYCIPKIKNNIEEYPVIDEYFMRFFNMYHQTVFYILSTDRKNASNFNPSSKSTREDTFRFSAIVKLLFRFLDVADEMSRNDTFNDLFYIKNTNPSTINTDNRVRLFDGKNVNLLERCFKGEDFTADAQTMLFALLLYACKFGISVDDDMKSFARSVRNALESKCYAGTQPVNIVHDYAINDIRSKAVYRLIRQLISEKQHNGGLLVITNEHATIDDLDFTNGNLMGGFLPAANGASLNYPLKDVFEVLHSWERLDDYEKSSLLILYGYSGKKMLTCALGDTYFFGSSEANRWRLVFSTDSNIVQPLQDIIQEYGGQRSTNICGTQLLRSMIINKKLLLSGFGFNYYTTQYSEFLNNGAYLAINGNRDAMNVELVKYSKKPATAYHTEPMALAVKNKLKVQPQMSNQTLYLTAFNKGGQKGYLCVYDTPTWDGIEPIACLSQVYGTHGNGGWSLEMNGTTTPYYDNAATDRVEAGVTIINTVFPNYNFADKG